MSGYESRNLENLINDSNKVLGSGMKYILSNAGIWSRLNDEDKDTKIQLALVKDGMNIIADFMNVTKELMENVGNTLTVVRQLENDNEDFRKRLNFINDRIEKIEINTSKTLAIEELNKKQVKETKDK